MNIVEQLIAQHEAVTRMSVFVSVLVLMLILEAVFPRKQRVLARGSRWLTNLALVVIDSIALRLLVPVAALSVAADVTQQGWGLLSWLELPVWLKCVIAIALLDMFIYWQHVASHRFAILWRFHKIHHADRDIDTSTGVRFHPIEIVLSMLYKFVCIAIIGAPVIAVFLFEIILNASAMFNHSNVRLPIKLDHYLRYFLVTPDFHRVHHSVVQKETNSNYGFFLPVWDRLFGSYTAQPLAGHDQMLIGLSEYQTNKPANLLWCLKRPFIRYSRDN